MKILLNYNFNPVDAVDGNFGALFGQRRRDATFAFAYETDSAICALRDHLGIAPLYYRREADSLRFALNLTDLVRPGDEIDLDGLRSFLALGTAKLQSPVRGVEIVPPGSVLRFDKVTGGSWIDYEYRITPRPTPAGVNLRQLVAEADELFLQAMKRIVRCEQAGVYLSGGIDSALIGIYLQKLGVKVNAYTSAPWGRTSSEIPYAEINARAIGVSNHFVDCLDTEKYLPAFQSIPQVYGGPHGTSTAVGVVSLWQNTPLAGERQIFLGQNSDTMTCSVPAQYLIFFSSYLPGLIRRGYGLRHDDLLRNYLHLVSRRTLDDHLLLVTVNRPGLSRLQLLTLAGMRIGHTPSDGEVLAQPAIARNIVASNPYYDMDLVEFCLSIPLRFRLAFSWRSKHKLALEKTVFRSLAQRRLPRKLVNRKKSFTVSFERDEKTKALRDRLPNELAGIPLPDTESRFAAGVFAAWCEACGLKLRS